LLALACACASPARSAAPGASPSASAAAPPWLECTYSASNETHTARVEPTQDPYSVKELDVAGRFALKLVYVSSPEDVAAFRVYVYEIEDEGPVLLQEAKYRPPFAKGTARGRSEFTGRQQIYAHQLGRELAYACAWVTP
jgi:hypothetical protein